MIGKSQPKMPKSAPRLEGYKRLCLECSKPMYRYPSDSRRYCSSKCAGIAARTHGEADKSPLYALWLDMRKRAGKQKGYLHVTVCKEWGDYPTFKKWALEHGYREDLVLDRRDNLLGYNPDNCRFVTDIGSARNVRSKSNTSSKYKGVRSSKTPGIWRAECSFGGRAKHLGYFSTEIEAAEAYDDYAFSVDSEHAYLNFPERLRNNVQIG